MSEKMDHQGFVSKEYATGRRMRTRYFDRQGYSSFNRSRDGMNDSGSMLAKIGICGLLCALVLLMNHFNSKDVLSAAAMELYNEDMGGDYLGKLRFVELPGIIQVFSSDSKLNIGVENGRYTLDDDNMVLYVLGCGEQTIPAPADCKVKGINQSGEAYTVALSLNNDLVISYGNVSDVKVEEGQPLKKGDTLFETKDSLEIRVYKKGRPADPEEYFNVKEQHSA